MRSFILREEKYLFTVIICQWRAKDETAEIIERHEIAAGERHGEHPEEPGDRADDHRGLRHPPRREPDVRQAGHRHSGKRDGSLSEFPSLLTQPICALFIA